MLSIIWELGACENSEENQASRFVELGVWRKLKSWELARNFAEADFFCGTRHCILTALLIFLRISCKCCPPRSVRGYPTTYTQGGREFQHFGVRTAPKRPRVELLLRNLASAVHDFHIWERKTFFVRIQASHFCGGWELAKVV